ncbi:MULTISPECIES: serine/threonine-protein kinase [unclassified Caballeronia]|uniref:serine/threonine-protein kinase n=1 Tax=unclassified Caballeronia TaxID=2646786 RepID=UPI00285F868C|nr:MULTISPECIES: serine/threonine-protein kinase [unclassified Caballeronia]MDR5776282.1 serine/threonine-protein kinase [Caballeronia sp. LZ002]MDR5851936.1 serine/threonine-protein kinase [Caballeronia sp. LZ003]
MKIPNRYKVLGPPKVGGFGQVTMCKDEVLDRTVVVKQILHPMHISRIIDEVVALQEAKSRHVVEIYDVLVSDTGEELSIVEEFLSGEDLSSFDFDSTNPTDLLKALFQIATGLRDMHARDVVHRDIKPDNMKFDSEGYIRIFDFGLAKTASLPAATKSLSGTPGYMAPELFSSSYIDKPVDIYAFGALIFRLVSKAVPPNARPWPQPPVPLLPHQGIENFGFDNPRLSPLVNACLSFDPGSRPTAELLSKTFERELLYGQHRATLVSGPNVFTLNQIAKPVAASHQGNSIQIIYDGIDFVVTATSGDAFVNNLKAHVGMILPDSAIITLGSAGARRFVPFDVSHPEVRI